MELKTIVDANPKLMPVLSIGVTLNTTNRDPDYLTQKKLFEFVDRIEEELEKLKSVSEVRVAGYKESELQIAVSPTKMKDYNVSLNDVN